MNCIECAKLKRENERLQTEIIRLANNWNELKKAILSLENKGNLNENQKSA